MKARSILILLLLSAMLLTSCSQEAETTPTAEPTATKTLEPTPTPGEPESITFEAPSVEEAAMAYLDAWKIGDYETMHSMLTMISREAMPYTDFEARYQNVMQEANIYEIEYTILQSLTNPLSAQVQFSLTLTSAIIGPITRDITMEFGRENAQSEWQVVWNDTIILPELAGGNTLSMERSVPSRGNIYYADGSLIASNTTAVAFGLIPSLIDNDDATKLISLVYQMTGLPYNYIVDLIYPEFGTPEWYIPLAEVPYDVYERYEDRLLEYDGWAAHEYDTRLYYDGGAAQTIGYVGTIQSENADQFIQRGYEIDEKVGQFGIELWAEPYLAGERGGSLYVISPSGDIVTLLAEAEPVAAKSVYTTLDPDLQEVVQNSIQFFNAAAVVVELDTGRVLSIASNPTFNPNGADPFNYNSEYYWADTVNDTDMPFFNRATQGQYPPGSIFKIISLAAALESEDYNPDTTFYCGHTWEKLEGVIKYDWTYEKELAASGELNMIQGLMRSCNPLFYDIGWTLYNRNLTSQITEMAWAFGLGQMTGIGALQEAAGNIEVPETLASAVDQAIGQSTTLITPLQAVMYAAAVGNDGVLMQPQIIEEIVGTDGEPVYSFTPQVNGTLPISDETLKAIQEGMGMVTQIPRGTAYLSFASAPVPVFGKTGTAENEYGVPHSWFVAYTSANRENTPDIAVVVLLSYQGEGSEWAAPITRRIISYYFTNSLGPLFDWEDSYNVWYTPEEEVETEE